MSSILSDLSHADGKENSFLRLEDWLFVERNSAVHDFRKNVKLIQNKTNLKHGCSHLFHEGVQKMSHSDLVTRLLQQKILFST